MRRILYVQRPRGGGSATGLCDLIRLLDRDRFEPVVLCYSENRFCDSFRQAGARVRVLEGGEREPRSMPSSVRRGTSGLRSSRWVRHWNRFLRRQLPTAFRVREVVADERPDLVHHNDNPRGDRASILGAYLAGVPQICHVRFLAEFFGPIDRPLSRLVDHFVYASRALETHYRDATGIDAARGRVVYDTVDFERFSPDPAAGARVRRSLGIPGDAPLVASIGRLVPWKGHDVFVEALSRIMERNGDVHGVVVGDDGSSAGTRGYRERLQALARERGVSGRVKFTGFRDDVPAVLAAADVFAHCAVEPEPFGRIIVEAMAVGTPVVATRAGGAIEIVRQVGSGLLVSPRSPGELGEAIQRLLRDRGLADRMAELGRHGVRETFGAAQFLEGLEGAYLTALQSSDRSTRAT